MTANRARTLCLGVVALVMAACGARVDDSALRAVPQSGGATALPVNGAAPPAASAADPLVAGTDSSASSVTPAPAAGAGAGATAGARP